MSVDPFQPILLHPDDDLSPAVVLEVLPYGLTLNRLLINGSGKTHDVLIGPNDVKHHQRDRKFQNCIVGRYCNRVPAAEHGIEKDGVQSVVTPIANEGPTVSLHGGPGGFDRSTFQPLSTDQSQLFSPIELATIKKSISSATIFAHTSPAGDEGYPGELLVEVLVAVSKPAGGSTVSATSREQHLGSVVLDYRAQIKGNSKTVTPVNLTQHWGFNLDASLTKPNNPAPDVKGHALLIKSDHILEGDNVLLPTGKLLPVKDTAFDFNKASETIGAKYPNPGYDHFWLFPSSVARDPTHIPLKGLVDGTQDLVSPLFATSSDPSVVLSSERSGIRLAFTSNQRGVQFYSGIGFDGSGTRKRIHGGSTTADSDGYLQGSAAFLEFHAPHSAFLTKFNDGGAALPDEDTILTKDEVYNHWVKLDIYYDASKEESSD